jgi:retron-type reverse transcriptase
MADGRQPLGIPTVRDRVAQMAVTIVLEPTPGCPHAA